MTNILNKERLLILLLLLGISHSFYMSYQSYKERIELKREVENLKNNIDLIHEYYQEQKKFQLKYEDLENKYKIFNFNNFKKLNDELFKN